MQGASPVLLLGFNRPEKMRNLIDAIRPNAPGHVLLAVDGPRATHPDDRDLVRRVQDCAQFIDWGATVEVLFRDENRGLRSAVTEAVTWAVAQSGRVIVLEDDCIPGPSLLPFLQDALLKFADEPRMAHVNGYNLVPRARMSRPSEPIRLTRYIESYAWATWERAWTSYDESLDWALHCSIDELAEIVGSRTAAYRWRINFRDAASGRINTWAYRWMATIWSRRWSVLAPNSNLCGYNGHTGGTHTLRKPRWDELAVEPADGLDAWLANAPATDRDADVWTGRTVFRENRAGLLEGIAASSAMELLRHIRK